MLVRKAIQHERGHLSTRRDSFKASAATAAAGVCRQCVLHDPRQIVPVVLQVKKGTQLGKEMESTMKEGKLVPTEVTVKLLRKAMQASSGDKFLIDGFPRAIDQAETFEQDVKPPALVLFFDCPEVG